MKKDFSIFVPPPERPGERDRWNSKENGAETTRNLAAQFRGFAARLTLPRPNKKLPAMQARIKTQYLPVTL